MSFERSATDALREFSTNGGRMTILGVKTSKELNYSERMKTFTLTKWSWKPNFLTPVVCASHGFVCIDQDMLQCVDCKCYVSALMPKHWHPKQRSAAAMHVVRKLVEGHDVNCLWRSVTTPECERAPNVNDNEVILKEFQGRYDSMMDGTVYNTATEDYVNVDSVEYASKEECTLDSDQIDRFRASVKTETTPVNDAAVLLAMCGWRAAMPTRAGVVLKCEFCLRMLPVFEFAKASTEPSAKRAKSALNPVGNHLPWCAWITQSTQSTLPTHVVSEEENLNVRYLVAVRIVCSTLQVEEERTEVVEEENTVEEVVEPDNQNTTLDLLQRALDAEQRIQAALDGDGEIDEGNVAAGVTVAQGDVEGNTVEQSHNEEEVEKVNENDMEKGNEATDVDDMIVEEKKTVGEL